MQLPVQTQSGQMGILTTSHVRSCYGIAVLVIDGRVYGAADEGAPFLVGPTSHQLVGDWNARVRREQAESERQAAQPPFQPSTCYSVLVYPDNTYQVWAGDWHGMTSDGSRPCRCVSVHPTAEDAEHAAQMERDAMRIEELQGDNP
jgi:hypothetical protein